MANLKDWQVHFGAASKPNSCLMLPMKVLYSGTNTAGGTNKAACNVTGFSRRPGHVGIRSPSPESSRFCKMKYFRVEKKPTKKMKKTIERRRLPNGTIWFAK